MAVRGVAAPSAGTIEKALVLGQSGIPCILLPSYFSANNGVCVIGQAPSAAATVSFSATSGAGVTMTFSAATLLGTAADVGRVLTILDTTYKYAVITAQSSTTVATVTLTGVLSGLGPFANNTIWLSGTIPATGNTTGFSSPLDIVRANTFVAVPAGGIAAGIPAAAAVYYAQWSSTTLLTIFNNVLASGAPTVPASPTAFVTTGVGAVATQTAANVPLITIVVPGNAPGPNGRLRIAMSSSNNNSANNKTAAIRWAGNNLFAGANTTNLVSSAIHDLVNEGVTGLQSAIPAGIATYGGSVSPPLDLAVDTTVNQNLTFTMNLANANDWGMYNWTYVEIWPGS